MKIIIYFYFMLVAIGFGLFAQTGSALAASQAEYRALQLWCMEYRKHYEKGGGRGKLTIPEGYFYGVGHYCRGLEAFNKAYVARSKTEAGYLVSEVQGEMGYVISKNPSNHPLMSDVYAVKGRAYALINKRVEAETNLRKALELDPNNVACYSYLADFLMQSNRKDKAIETVKTGLAVDPQNKALRRLATELGIKPAPLKPESVVTEPAVEPIPKTGSVVPEPASIPLEVESAPVNATSQESPKIGSPNNPWCRFCPEPVAKP